MSVAFSCGAAAGAAAVLGPEDIGLEDAAAGAAALDVRQVDALGLGHAAGDGRDADAVGEDLLLGLLSGLRDAARQWRPRGDRGLRHRCRRTSCAR